MNFEFATATRIVFGPGKLRELGPAARSMGRRALIVTGRNPERADRAAALLEAEGVGAVTFHGNGEPTLDEIKRGVKLATEERCDLIIGLGGGSALDAAKAIAALITNPGELLSYLEVIGSGKPLPRPAAPCITVPTTAGTGTEVTRNAVLASPEHRVKVSLRSAFMLPRLALVDPELTYDLPRSITASTGLDALTQLIEAFVCIRANPVTDGFCVEGIRRAAASLRVAYEKGSDPKARKDMSLAALLSGLALANAGLGAVHGFAAPIGGMFSAPHGAICAALLPHCMETNINALGQRSGNAETMQRFEFVGQLLTGKATAKADDGVAWLKVLCQELQIPPLRTYGIRREDFPVLIEKAAVASSMKANPVQLTAGELTAILERAL